jgi:hypothetical protein
MRSLESHFSLSIAIGSGTRSRRAPSGLAMKRFAHCLPTRLSGWVFSSANNGYMQLQLQAQNVRFPDVAGRDTNCGIRIANHELAR